MFYLGWNKPDGGSRMSLITGDLLTGVVICGEVKIDVRGLKKYNN